MDIRLFVNLTSRAWAIAILAHLQSGVAARQAPLLAATGASRTAFGQSLEHLTALGLLDRNPGHGHPLRPEFRLTDKGTRAAMLAHQIHFATARDDRDLLRKAWTLPVLTTLDQHRRFSEIRRSLDSITDRALSQSLKTLEARHWITRDVDSAARPPRALYRPVNAGQAITRIVAPAIAFH